MLQCLWLSRVHPFPADSGDRIYTVRLAGALARAGARVVFYGLGGESGPVPPPGEDLGVAWRPVEGRQGGALPALLSPAPLVAARFNTPAYRAAVRAALAEAEWDVVVIDQYGLGWALPLIGRRWPDPAVRPLLIHVSHDHEETVTRQLHADCNEGPAKRLALQLNAWKTARYERWVVDSVDLVTVITAEDGATYARRHPRQRFLPLTPGFSGRPVAVRRIDARHPRRAVLLGSFGWIAKQMNLRDFLAVADPELAAAGVELEVVGPIPAGLRAELAPTMRATRFTGFVDDPAVNLAAARLGIVAEPRGGGFKLKMLDYVLNRVPVAGLAVSVTGIPEAVGRHFLLADDLPALARTIVAAIDDVERLNRLQEQAFAAALPAFAWEARGAALLRGIEAGLARRPRPRPGAQTRRLDRTGAAP
jgi:glycosyltransferase involved in cell wall biosynthesis